MIISDEMLSGFLDAALSDADMQRVRQQLVENEQLAERLADLALVDSIVQQHYDKINQQPMPEAVLNLLLEQPATTEATTTESAEIIQFPWWRKVQQHLQHHAAAVACIALFAGYGLSQLGSESESITTALNSQIIQVLNSARSGQAYTLNANDSVTPRLSFISQQGSFCRQYGVQSISEQSENIACKEQGQWQLKASLSQPGKQNSGLYQTASGPSALDPILDQLMAGPALSAAAEQQQLTEHKN
ncbi:hypothetical protein BI198_00780 [Rheinheimera salexigens]|uniref:Anti-sigma factor n=2 Tax=Rheinheimera salexigens TaxID=1628148 RepID=A0A1E7Q9K8_9GAMM|nr:hypothetical protein BI198_00780 [Rheinheimera salexigens]